MDILEELKIDVLLVLKAHPWGVTLVQFPGAYLRLHGRPLNLAAHGLTSLEEMVGEMSEIVERRWEVSPMGCKERLRARGPVPAVAAVPRAYPARLLPARPESPPIRVPLRHFPRYLRPLLLQAGPSAPVAPLTRAQRQTQPQASKAPAGPSLGAVAPGNRAFRAPGAPRPQRDRPLSYSQALLGLVDGAQSGVVRKPPGAGPTPSGGDLTASGGGPMFGGGPRASGVGPKASGAVPKASAAGLTLGAGPKASRLGPRASGAGRKASGAGPSPSGVAQILGADLDSREWPSPAQTRRPGRILGVRGSGGQPSDLRQAPGQTQAGAEARDEVRTEQAVPGRQGSKDGGECIEWLLGVLKTKGFRDGIRSNKLASLCLEQRREELTELLENAGYLNLQEFLADQPIVETVKTSGQQTNYLIRLKPRLEETTCAIHNGSPAAPSTTADICGLEGRQETAQRSRARNGAFPISFEQCADLIMDLLKTQAMGLKVESLMERFASKHAIDLLTLVRHLKYSSIVDFLQQIPAVRLSDPQCPVVCKVTLEPDMEPQPPSQAPEPAPTAAEDPWQLRETIVQILERHADGISIFELKWLFMTTTHRPLVPLGHRSVKELLQGMADRVSLEGLGVQTRVFGYSATAAARRGTAQPDTGAALKGIWRERRSESGRSESRGSESGDGESGAGQTSPPESRMISEAGVATAVPTELGLRGSRRSRLNPVLSFPVPVAWAPAGQAADFSPPSLREGPSQSLADCAPYPGEGQGSRSLFS
uniref:uncharacterized protein isoform X1 n=1 Tax=Pristiophorus japonicus TaxID=55135 RepID=UPI00398EE8AA